MRSKRRSKRMMMEDEEIMPVRRTRNTRRTRKTRNTRRTRRARRTRRTRRARNTRKTRRTRRMKGGVYITYKDFMEKPVADLLKRKDFKELRKDIEKNTTPYLSRMETKEVSMSDLNPLNDGRNIIPQIKTFLSSKRPQNLESLEESELENHPYILLLKAMLESGYENHMKYILGNNYHDLVHVEAFTQAEPAPGVPGGIIPKGSPLSKGELDWSKLVRPDDKTPSPLSAVSTPSPLTRAGGGK